MTVMLAEFSARLQEIIPSVSFYGHAFPIIIFLFTGAITLLWGTFTQGTEKPHLPGTVLGLIAASIGVVTYFLPRLAMENAAFLAAGFMADELSRYGFLLISLGTFFTILIASRTNAGRNLLKPELLALLLWAAAGMMVMISAGDLMALFIGLELLSLPLYVLVGYQRKDARALEAAVKYFFPGAAAAAMFLMGSALLYMQTGTLRIEDLAMAEISLKNPLGLMGGVFLICALAFKLAIAPFHAWAPDVYQGAHSTLTGFMSTLVKATVVIVLFRMLMNGISGKEGQAVPMLFWVFAAVSAIWGSIQGLVQRSLKRILAYSSVANAGFFALGLLALSSSQGSLEAKLAIVYYLPVYMVLNMGAFAVLALLEEGNAEDLLRDEIAGLGQRSRFHAIALSIFLIGLAGIPPLAGFFGKFFLFHSAVKEGFVGVTVVLALCSVVALYYYLSPVVDMWFKSPGRRAVVVSETSSNLFSRTLVLVMVIFSFGLGILGPRWMDYESPRTAEEGSRTGAQSSQR